MDSDRVEGAARNIAGSGEEVLGGLVGDAKTQANGKIDKLAGTAQNAYGKAKDAAADIAGDAQEAVAGMRAALQDRVRKVGAQAAEVGGQVYQQATEAGRYATQTLKEQPLATMLIVGVLGGVLGFLLGRSTAPEPTLRDYAQRAIPRRYR